MSLILVGTNDGNADETTSRRPSGPTRSDTRTKTTSGRMTRRERKTRSEPKTRRGRTRRRWDRSAAAKPRGECGQVTRLAFDGGRISAPGLQRPGGGAGPRTARASGDERPLGRRPVAQAIEMVNRFAVVIMPPLSTAHCRSQRRCTHSDVLKKYFGFVSCRCSASHSTLPSSNLCSYTPSLDEI